MGMRKQAEKALKLVVLAKKNTPKGSGNTSRVISSIARSNSDLWPGEGWATIKKPKRRVKA